MEDQSANKRKLTQIGIKTHLGLSFGQFFGEQNVEREKKRREEKRRRERREESQERYGFLYTSMELVWKL